MKGIYKTMQKISLNINKIIIFQPILIIQIGEKNLPLLTPSAMIRIFSFMYFGLQ